MDEDQKKKVMMIVAIVCIAAAASIIYWTNFRGSGGSTASGPMYLKCMNPACGKTEEISRKEFQKRIEDLGAANPMMGMGPVLLKCKFCGKKTATMAEKCPKCGEIFVPNYQAKDGFSDRCPKCGYSEMEEAMKKRKQ